MTSTFKAMKRILAFALTFALVVTMVPAVSSETAPAGHPEIDYTVDGAGSVTDAVPVTLYDYDRSTSNTTVSLSNRNAWNVPRNGGSSSKRLMKVNEAAYQAAQVPNKDTLYFGDVSSDEYTAFYPHAGFWTPADWNHIVTGIVKDEMRDGALAFNDSIADPGFFTPKSNGFKTVYSDVSFHTEKDSEGYYYFDSSRQTAAFDEDENKITVRNGGGNFLPLGKYSFGMSMNIRFLLPQDGQVNNEDMVFDFSGDDDVWVFVDGKLALDIGGIHGAKSGSINFSTGNATVASSSYYVGTASRTGAVTKDLYDDLGIDDTPDSLHTLSMYYLERGDGESNCKFRYNLQQTSSLTVGKTVSVENEEDLTQDEIDEAKNREFEFQVQFGESADALTPFANQAYQIQENGSTIDTGTTDDEGKFTLTDNQKAVFLPAESDIDDIILGGGVLAVTETGAEDYDTAWTLTQNGDQLHDSGPDDKDAVIQLPATGGGAESQAVGYGVQFTNSITVEHEPQNDDVEQSKTAVYDETDENGNRKYEITLTAGSNKIDTEPGDPVEVTTPADIVLVLDVTGSMDDEVSSYYPFDGWDDEEADWRGTQTGYYQDDDGNFQRLRREAYLVDLLDWEFAWGDWKNDKSKSVDFEPTHKPGAYVPKNDWDNTKAGNGKTQTGYYQDGGDYQVTTRSAYNDRGWKWGDWSDGTPTHELIDGEVTRMDALRATAYDFVNSLPEESKVAIRTFTENSASEIGLTSLADDRQQVLDKITNLGLHTSSKGTQIYIGLNKAITALEDSDNTNQVIVAFTDGEDKSDNTERLAKDKANEAKNKGVRIFTISLLGSANAHVDTFLTGLSSASPDDETQYYYSCTDMTGLADAMTKISESTGDPVVVKTPIQTKTITDVLDPRFELQDGERDRLEDDGATVTVEGGVTTIVWEDQELPAEGVWSKTIKIQAKADFLGGNDIPTNGPGSEIVCEDDTVVEFDEPTVNVPIAFDVDDEETTIFLGENVPTELNEEAVQRLMFNEGDWNWYGKGATGEFTYQWFNADGDEIGDEDDFDATKDALQALTPFGNSNVYTLKVSFTPDPADAELDSSGPVQEKVTEQNDYTVNVVRGSIQVTKKIDKSEIWYANGDPIFTFKLERLVNGDAVETSYRTVRFEKANEGDGGTLTQTALFSDLKKGIYRVTEQDSLRHTFYDCSVDTDDNASSVKSGEAILVYLGYTSKDNSRTDIEKDFGSTVFENAEKKLDTPYFSHTDVKSNSFRITFTGDNHTVNQDGTPADQGSREVLREDAALLNHDESDPLDLSEAPEEE